MAKLVDAPALGAGPARDGGSNPLLPTAQQKTLQSERFLLTVLLASFSRLLHHLIGWDSNLGRTADGLTEHRTAECVGDYRDYRHPERHDEESYDTPYEEPTAALALLGIRTADIEEHDDAVDEEEQRQREQEDNERLDDVLDDIRDEL